MLLEPLRVRPGVAVFGMGHVGLELARVLSRHELDLRLVDSRTEMLEPERLSVLDDAVASIRPVHAPVPESVLADLTEGTHVLVMTHDHVEDLAIVDQALRTEGIESIGLIGSASKWARFRKKLGELGHGPDDLARVTTPIGIPEVAGKQPAAIAVSVAARMLQLIDEHAAIDIEESDASGTDAAERTEDATVARTDAAPPAASDEHAPAPRGRRYPERLEAR